ncbi:hypothetical protein KR067_000364 [Drosophila pandora]|nr:hypothetical protein KR067_000364 [Drosophila pandora]
MDNLKIEQKVLIRRSDGRVHMAKILKLDGSGNKMVTVEWVEGHVVRGKELPVEVLMLTNPHLFDAPRRSPDVPEVGVRAEGTNQTASIRPRSMVLGGVKNRLLENLLKARVANPPLRLPSIRRDRVMAPPVERVRTKIDQVREQRERRREQTARTRELKEQQRKDDPGNPNWEIDRMIRQQKQELKNQPLKDSESKEPRKQHEILVCVRKRPLNRKEMGQRELDVISVPNNECLVVHEPRKQVNLIKYVDNHSFRFDYVFDEECSNTTVYQKTARPLVQHVFEGGMATCFAYGQTGSGKTHTMGGEFHGRQKSPGDGIYAMAAKDFFALLSTPPYAALKLKVCCSFFEIYGTKVSDLLMPGKPILRVLEDGHRQVQVVGLTEKPVTSTNEVLAFLELGNSVRTSGQTSANSMSSRSHAIFQILLRASQNNRLHGKFSLIDLAGNERGADNCSANRQTRLEGADINKSLLALKECIRALGQRNSSHLPFRGSKLTQVLRDSFIGGKKVKTCMIAMISPGLHSVEHTLNTLRYANRVKELTVELVTRRTPNTAEATPQSSSGDDETPTTDPGSQPDVIYSSTVPEQYPLAKSSTSVAKDVGRVMRESPARQGTSLNDLNVPQRRVHKLPAAPNYVRPARDTRHPSTILLANSLATYRGSNFP